MASGAVSFVLNLVNNISGPASQALRSVTDLRGGLMALTSWPALIGGGVAAAGIKSIIDAAGYKQQQLIAFGTALHSTSEAAKVYQRAVAFAATTPFETKETVDATRNLLAFGFTAEQTFAVLKRAGNIAAGTSKPLSQVVLAFQALKSGDFGQAFGAGQGFSQLGISRQMLQAEGLRFDKSGSYLGSVTAALTAVRKIADRNFGGLMDVQSRSITGLASTLASRPFELFSSLMPNNGAGGPLSSMQKFMANLSEMTNFEAGPGAKIKERFQKSMGGLFSAVFDPLASATSGDKGIQFVNRLLDKLDQLAGWWRTYGPTITANAKGFLDGLLAAGQVMWAIISPVITFVTWIGKLNSSGSGGLGKTIGLVLGLAVGLRALNGLTLGLGPMLGRMLFNSVANSGWLFSLIMNPAGMLAGIGAAFASVWATVSAGAISAFTAINAALGPIGWAVLAITAVGAGLTYLYRNYQPFRTLVDSTWDRTKSGYQKAGQWLAYGWDKFSTAINRADTSTNGWFAEVGSWFSDLPGKIGGWFSGIGDTIAGFFNAIPGKLSGLGASLYNAILPQPVRDLLEKFGVAPSAPSPTGTLPAPSGPLKRTDPALLSGVQGIAQRMGLNPSDLLAIINQESTLNPGAVHRNRAGQVTAAGLIQFQSASAGEMGTSLSAIQNMTAAQQMPFIEKYLRMHGVKAGMGLDQLYMSILSGNVGNTSMGYARGSINGNLDTDHDGRISAAEAAAQVRKNAAAAGIQITNVITLGKKPTAQDIKAVEAAAHAGSARAFDDYMGALGNQNGLGGHL